ncbi:MAG TPA: SDR family oxidoreductase [Hyphomicrobium sp.]
MIKNVFVTGGAGYIGSLLTPQLLANGYRVTVYDILYFGDFFLPKDNPNLTVVKGDIRDTRKLAAAMKGHDAVINLACISNDASFELDERLSTSVNLDAFEPMVIAAKAAGVRRFIYASSSSVYGVSDAPDVTEDHPLVPITLYNRYKGMCEPQLLAHTDRDFVGVVFRPATVCGYAPRLRLDLSVNILTNHAVTNNKITVFGGSQLRPNLHIQDYIDLCLLLLTAPDASVANQILNCGDQNMTIRNLADLVKRVVEQEFPEKATIAIVTTPSNDNRSYHINSDKIRKVLGFAPKYSIEDAVRGLCHAFRAGLIKDSMTNDWYYNVRTLTKLKAA